MGLNLVASAAVLALGVVLAAPGIQMAAVALTVAMSLELALLARRARGLVPNLFAAG